MNSLVNYRIMPKEITFDRFIRWVGIGAIVLAVFLLVDYLSSVLLPFFIAWLFAYLLYPMVKFVENKLHVRVRALSIIITMIVVFAVIGGMFYFIIPPMIEQFQRLYVILTHWVHGAAHTNNISGWISNWLIHNQHTVEHFFKSPDFTNILKNVAPKLFSVVSQTASIVMSIVASLITLLYMFFILMDYEFLTNNWIRIFPVKNRPFWHELAGDVALCMGVMFCIGFTIMDFPMAIGLGILIGVLDLVPYLHTFALIPTAFLAMLKAADTGQNFWMVFGLAVGLFALVQVITDMIVTPHIMGKAMGLNPAILLLSLSVWGAILGFIGLIVALPLTTLLITYWKKYVTKEESVGRLKAKPISNSRRDQTPLQQRSEASFED